MGCTRESGQTSPPPSELERLFDLSLQLLGIAGVDGYFKRVNPAFEKTLGYPAEEFLCQPFIEFVHPDDRETTRREIEKLAAGIPTVSFENRYRTKEGGYRWLAWTAVPQSGEGLIYATAMDITGRKQAEQLFRGLLEAAPDATVIVDRHGKIMLVNAAAERTFGYGREELLGQRIEILVPPRFRAQHHRQSAEYLADPRIRLMGGGRDFAALRKDGSEFPAEISLSWLQTEEGLYVVSAIRDVTLRKQAEGELVKKEAQLRAAQSIQQHLLPRQAPVVPGFDLAGALYPAEYAAGDCFDYLAMANGAVGIAVGDVSGHGVGPALVMASVQAFVRVLAETTSDVAEILRRVNTLLARETEEGCFVTMLLGRLDPAAQTFTYASAGHVPGFLLDQQGNVKQRLESNLLPLAVLPEIDCPAVSSVPLDPGDILVLLTDGILEAAPPGERMFGSDHMLEVIRANRHGTAAEIVDALHRTVRQFSRREDPQDDVTAVVIKALNGGPEAESGGWRK